MLATKILDFLEKQQGRVYAGNIEQWCSELGLDNSAIDDIYHAVKEIKFIRTAAVEQHGNGFLSVRLLD